MVLVRLLPVVFVLLPVLAFAHGGSTDSNGCHNDRRNGGYHCHGGGSGSSSQRWTELDDIAASPPAKASRATGKPDAGVSVTRAAAPAKPAASKAEPPAESPSANAAPATTAAQPKGDGTAGCVCLFFMAAGVAWVVHLFRKRPKGGASDRARQSITTLAASASAAPEPQLEAETGPFRLLQKPKKGKRMFEKEMEAYRYGPCSTCTIRIRPGDRIYWDPYDKEARHADTCEGLVERTNAEAAKEAERKAQVKKSAAFHALMERLQRAKTSTTRGNIVATAKADDALTPQQRLRLLLEASKLDTDDTLERVEALKSKAVKRRRLEEALATIKGDDVPDEMQTEQIALLEEALQTLESDA